MNIEAGEAIALWEPDMDGEFELADALNNEVVLVVNALKTEYRRNEERKAADDILTMLIHQQFQQHQCDIYLRMERR